MGEEHTRRFHESFLKMKATEAQAAALEEAERFLETGRGDPAALTGRLPPGWEVAVRRVLEAPTRTTAADRRGVELLVRLGAGDSVGTWVDKFLDLDDDEGQDNYAAAAALLRELEVPEHEIAVITARNIRGETAGRPTSAGRYLLGLDEETYAALAGAGTLVAERMCRLLVRCGQKRHQRAGAVFLAGTDPATQMNGRPDLARADPEKYMGDALGRLVGSLNSNNYKVLELARRALYLLGARSVPAFEEYMSMPASPTWESEVRRAVLGKVVAELGDDAAPVLWVAAERAEPMVRMAAVEHLVRRRDPAILPRVERAVLEGLAEPARAAKLIPLVAQLATPASVERLWELAVQKYKAARAAAAETLAKADPNAAARAAGLLSENSKHARWGAVLILSAVCTPAAAGHLLDRLPDEPDDDVRDEIVRGLRTAGTPIEAIADRLGPVDWDDLRRRAAATESPAEWIRNGLLTPLRRADGGELDLDLVRYLLHRQSRQKEPAPDPEATRLYAVIDRRATGDFARALLGAFLDSGPDKADAWVLIVAGLLGDNRVITTLATQIRKWADSSDQKLGGWGIEALSLNGSDAALMAVDAIARKFAGSPRRKHAVIGEAAQNAIERAAKRIGVSMDDLGDRIVPAFGFEPGRPRRIEAGKKTIEATIGLDFKLSMTDAATGKRAATIPKAAPPEVQAEFKGLGKLLGEVAKVQSARLEGLMVRQHRWAGARWRELFLQHPLLFPFAVRLVWGVYDEQGKPATLFRALPDRSLTDPNDDPVDPPADDAAVGIVHPLDLSPQQIETWRTHLGDYEIEPPFEQIDRRVVTVPPGMGAATTYDRLKGATLNGMSFRGKTERAGWTRGQSGDGGMIYAYRKRFPALAVDAFITLDGLPAWADVSAVVTLHEAFFLPAGARPDRIDATRMRLGDVPVMAFSESIGDLMRISGRGEATEDQVRS